MEINLLGLAIGIGVIMFSQLLILRVKLKHKEFENIIHALYWLIPFYLIFYILRKMLIHTYEEILELAKEIKQVKKEKQ